MTHLFKRMTTLRKLTSSPSWRRTSTWVVIVVAVGLWAIFAAHVSGQEQDRANRLIENLAAGHVARVGHDFTWIDMEHSPYNPERLGIIISALGRARNEKGQLITPLVRIPAEGDQEFRWIVKQVLERGALGIIFPHVETKEQAIYAVRTMRYPNQKGAKHPYPPGIRGVSMQNFTRTPGLGFRADVWPLNPEGELFAMVMIEDAEGAKNANEIAEVPGIGAVFVAPNDLGVSLGVGPWEPNRPPETEAAIQTVLRACLANDVVCATIVATRAELEERVQQGFRLFIGAGAAR